MSFSLYKHSIIKATLWMMGTLTCFLAMAIGGRELSTQLGTFQILFFRSLIGLLIIGFLLFRSGWRRILTKNLRLHTIRNFAHFGGQYGWFYGIAYIPLAEVFALEFTVPIWTALLATILLGERLTHPRIIAIGFGIAGVLIILRPGLAVINPAALAVLGGAVCYALSHALTRKIAQVDSPLVIIFYMTIIQLPLGFLPALKSWVIPSFTMWPWLFVVGITGVSAHYCLARALALADATVVVPLDFLRLPLIALVGFVFYGEMLNWFVLIGALVMLVGNFVNIRAERLEQINKPMQLTPKSEPVNIK
jgi:drug/metabolite transporter (DMT)-like permease